MPKINNPEYLRPDVRAIYEAHKREANDAGIPTVLVETVRTSDVQEAYYAQGREPLDVVNAKRKKAGLYQLSAEENKRIVTNSKIAAYHGTGRAYDLAPSRIVDGAVVPWWTAPAEIWLKLAVIGERLGMRWGGRWKGLNDVPHYETD